MSTRSVDIQVLSTLEELEALAPEYEACHAASPAAGPYTCFDWFHAFVQLVPQEGPSRTCVIRRDGRVVAIIPLVRKRIRRGMYELRSQSLSFSMRQEAVIAAEVQHEPVIAWALEHLLRHDQSFVSCRLARVPVGSPLLATAQNGTYPFLVDSQPEGASVVIEIPESWEAYRATLSASQKKTISRRVNGLSRVGTIRLERIGLEPTEDMAAVDRLSEDALTVSQRSWQGAATWGKAISDPTVVGFFREVNRRMARRGMLDLSVLYVNDQPISFMWGAARKPFTSLAKLGYDASWQDHSPGVVHLAMLIQDTIPRGFTMIDWGHQFTEYKSRWSKRADELVQLQYYPRRPLPRLVRMIRRWRQSEPRGAVPAAPSARSGEPS